MNPWENLLKLMDATPAPRRRLLTHMAWNHSMQCGCVFGTFDPTIDREKSWQYDYSRLTHPQPLVGEWLASMGFSQADCLELQAVNDRGVVYNLTPEDLWRFIHAYVDARAGRVEIKYAIMHATDKLKEVTHGH